MSTLKVAAINHPSASTGGLTISTGGIVTGGGLDYITSSSFTTASTVSVDGCFTSAYDNYRIIVRAIGSTTIQSVRMRLRLSGTDASTNYAGWRSDMNAAYSGGSNTTEWLTIYVISTATSSSVIDLTGPALAATTTISHQGFRPDNYNSNGSGHHTDATAYDGFTLTPASGTITGTVTVFGYRKA